MPRTSQCVCLRKALDAHLGLVDEGPDLPARDRVHARGGLVQHHTRGVADEGGRHAEPALHAARVALAEPVGSAREMHGVQELRGSSGRSRSLHPGIHSHGGTAAGVRQARDTIRTLWASARSFFAGSPRMAPNRCRCSRAVSWPSRTSN